jgi:hypothetical protein
VPAANRAAWESSAPTHQKPKSIEVGHQFGQGGNEARTWASLPLRHAQEHDTKTIKLVKSGDAGSSSRSAWAGERAASTGPLPLPHASPFLHRGALADGGGGA